MRNVLLTLSIVLLPFLGISQTFLTSTGTDSATAYGSTIFNVNNYLRSASGTSVTVTWTVTDFHLDPNWKMTGLCDNITCYNNDPTTDPPNGYVLNKVVKNSDPYSAAGGDFHVIYDATTAANGTSSWVKVDVRDVPGLTSRNMKFIGIKSATGVYSVTASSDDVVLYPNPARDAVNVIYDAKADIKTIAVFNLIGKLMGPIYKPSSSSSAKIELDDMPNGVYFIRLMNSQGHVVATRRFTRQ